MCSTIRFVGSVIACVSGFAAAGCGLLAPPPLPPPFKAAIVVEGDPGEPVAGATVRAGASGPEVVTDATGRSLVVLRGVEGDVRDVAVQCPAAHQPLAAPVRVRLTRVVGDRVPEYRVSCPPLRRRVVVAVRAENGPNLPVLYLNQVVATTDASGAAHFALELEPGTFQVAIDSSSRKDLKPPNPSRLFTVAQRDDILLFQHKFDVAKQKKRIWVAPPPAVPRELGGGSGLRRVSAFQR